MERQQKTLVGQPINLVMLIYYFVGTDRSAGVFLLVGQFCQPMEPALYSVLSSHGIGPLDREG